MKYLYCKSEHQYSSSCGCGGHSEFGPIFLTKEEKITKLEQYLKDSQEQTKTIEERITVLKGKE